MKVADRVHTSHKDVRFIAKATIRTREREITLGVRKPDPTELTRARELFKNAADPLRLTMDELYAQETIRLHEAEPT